MTVYDYRASPLAVGSQVLV